MQTFRVSVAEILGQPGEYRDWRVQAPLEGISNPLGSVTDEPLDARLRAESVIEGILVTGTAAAEAKLECARCLKPLETDLQVEVCELFVGPGHEAPEEEDPYRVEGLEIDLEPMLRDAVALALPVKPICAEDCAGMCGRCGQDLNEGTCNCTDEGLDPRWAALSELRDRLA